MHATTIVITSKDAPAKKAQVAQQPLGDRGGIRFRAGGRAAGSWAGPRGSDISACPMLFLATASEETYSLDMTTRIGAHPLHNGHGFP